MRKVILHPLEGGRYLADVPSLPGCQIEGETRQEAIEKITALIPLYIESLQESGQPIPDESVANDWQDDVDIVTV